LKTEFSLAPPHFRRPRIEWKRRRPIIPIESVASGKEQQLSTSQDSHSRGRYENEQFRDITPNSTPCSFRGGDYGRGSSRRVFMGAALTAVLRGQVHVEKSAPHLETVTQWLRASQKTRRLALPSGLDRIREMDSSLHAWVQILPQESTGHGSLSEIPFGVKDIVETRGLATEYGSPIHKGRIGSGDAAIVRELRSRGAVLLGKTETTAFAYQTPAHAARLIGVLP
jgi:hypothetical protein